MSVESYNLNTFDYVLPSHLIAQYPQSPRGMSRLLCLNVKDGSLYDQKFQELPNLLRPGDILVFNNTKVMPARLMAHKISGGRVEILIERLESSRIALAHVRANKSCKIGSHLILNNNIEMAIEILDRNENLFRLQASIPFIELMQSYGQIPLPPYIKRPVEAIDYAHYQTVFAKHLGAIAAPTAGLHFDMELLQELERLGIQTAYVTLHVGAGTFQPVRMNDLDKHVMHREWCEVTAAVCEQIASVRAGGGRVIAVGTTAVRSLEAAAYAGTLQPFMGFTQLFIRPGYQFKVIDGLITNFHLPRSTLLMLVCAFGGLESVMAAYRYAIVREYRFYSYGDAMFIHRKGPIT